jgi:hypothetical protein
MITAYTIHELTEYVKQFPDKDDSLARSSIKPVRIYKTEISIIPIHKLLHNHEIPYCFHRCSILSEARPPFLRREE